MANTETMTIHNALAELKVQRAHSRDFSHELASKATNNTVGTTGIYACGDHIRPEMAGSMKQESRDFSRERFKGGNKDDSDSGDIFHCVWFSYADLRGFAQLHLLLVDGRRYYRVA